MASTTASTATTTENERMLHRLQIAEHNIVAVLDAASAMCATLAYSGHDADSAKEDFSAQYSRFMNMLSSVQAQLRVVFRHLSDSGILTTSLPYGASSEGEEKDFELAAQSVLVIKERLRAGVHKVLGVDIAAPEDQGLQDGAAGRHEQNLDHMVVE